MKSFRQGNALFPTLCVLLGGFVFLFQGCSFFSTGIASRLNPWGAGSKTSSQSLIKKVGVMPLINMTEYKDALNLEPLESRINETLVSACTGAAMVTAREKNSPAFLKDPPKNAQGAMDSMALTLIAREGGFNLILLPALTKVDHEKQSSWWNWLIADDDLLMTAIRIEVYDTHTGAKVFHDNFMEEKEIKAVSAKKLSAPEIMAHPAFETLFAKLAKRMAKKISREIQDVPWNGFIVSTDGKTGVLSAGSNIGIKEGQEFSVSKDRNVLTGYDNNQYLAPGPAADTVKVTEVGPDQARVISLSGKPLEKGAVVQGKTLSK